MLSLHIWPSAIFFLTFFYSYSYRKKKTFFPVHGSGFCSDRLVFICHFGVGIHVSSPTIIRAV